MTNVNPNANANPNPNVAEDEVVVRTKLNNPITYHMPKELAQSRKNRLPIPPHTPDPNRIFSVEISSTITEDVYDATSMTEDEVKNLLKRDKRDAAYKSLYET